MAARTPTRLHIILWHVTNPNSSVSISTITCFKVNVFEYSTTERRTNAVSHHRTNVSNCSALLSRDHTTALAHAFSRTERRSFDELTRTVNHSYSEGLASSAKGTTEIARACPNERGPARVRTDAQARLHDRRRSGSQSKQSRRITLCCLRAASRGVAWQQEVAQRAVHRLARRLHSLSFCFYSRSRDSP